MRNTQLVESVDNALRVLLLLRDRDAVRVSDVAEELGIGVATAHRLLATLKYRGFVEQNPDRRYAKGPALAGLLGQHAPTRDMQEVLEEVSPGHLTWLRAQSGETCNLTVLAGTEVLFLVGEESTQALRVTARPGSRMPAHLTAAGKALLAALPRDEIDRLYPPAGVPDLGLDADGVAALHAQLAAVRRRGYGVQRAESERGIAAVGMCLFGPDRGRPVGAINLVVPSVRFNTARIPGMVDLVARTRRAIEADLADLAA